MNKRKYKEGDIVEIDLGKAKSNRKFISSYPEASLEVKITKVYDDSWSYPYQVKDLSDITFEGYKQHIREDWIIEAGNPCKNCNSEKLYNQNLDEYFCPFCENED